MRVLYLDQAGGGMADEVDLPESATIEDFMRAKKDGAAISDYTVTVNRVLATPNQRLNNGDIVSVTPKKYGGAR